MVCGGEWNELCLRLWMRVMSIHTHITQTGSGSGLSCSYLLCECPCAAAFESNEPLIDSCCLWAQWGSSTHNILLASLLFLPRIHPPQEPCTDQPKPRFKQEMLFCLVLVAPSLSVWWIVKLLSYNLPLPVWEIMRICPSLPPLPSCFLCISNSLHLFFIERVY